MNSNFCFFFFMFSSKSNLLPLCFTCCVGQYRWVLWLSVWPVANVWVCSTLYYIYFQGTDYRAQLQLGNGALFGASYIQVLDLLLMCNRILIHSVSLFGNTRVSDPHSTVLKTYSDCKQVHVGNKIVCSTLLDFALFFSILSNRVRIAALGILNTYLFTVKLHIVRRANLA